MLTNIESQRYSSSSSSFSRTSSRSSSSSELECLILSSEPLCEDVNNNTLQRSLSERIIIPRDVDFTPTRNNTNSSDPTKSQSSACTTTSGSSTDSAVRTGSDSAAPGSCEGSTGLVERVSATTTTPTHDAKSASTAAPAAPSSRGIRGLVRRRKEAGKNFEPSAYISKRTMTQTQERMNAVTVLPGAIFCLYFLLSGNWMLQDLVDSIPSSELAMMQFGSDGTSSGCLSIPAFPNLYAVPPLPVISVAVGIILHAPFSFVYHWHFCTKLPPGLPRLEHWSRRMDQAFIHVISTCMSYGSSGRWDYFFANLVFNAHCMVKMFQPLATPRKTQARILVSFLAYTIPFLRRGDTASFFNVWAVMSTAIWFFCTYPIGGWSHSAFHVAIAFVPPVCLQSACHLQASQKQIRRAAACAGILLAKS